MLVRHGEAECNVNRVVGGLKGCTGLTDLGRRQVAALADRLYESGELREATALYSSVLPRAVETAERLRPVGGAGPTALGPVVQRCDLCELHPGECDGMAWSEVVEAFGVPDWDRDPTVPDRAGRRELVGVRGAGLRRRAAPWWPEHPGELVVAAVHAGVIEATHDRVPRRAARGLPAGLGAHRPRLHDRVGVGAGGGPLGPAALQRRLRGAPPLRPGRGSPYLCFQVFVKTRPPSLSALVAESTIPPLTMVMGFAPAAESDTLSMSELE